MGQCSCNPQIESRHICMKHNIYLCQGCLTCRDPQLYCKYRSACIIWFMTKHGDVLDQAEKVTRVAE